MNDPDAEVRKVAYEYSGELCDERVITPITEMLKNEADVRFSLQWHKRACENVV